MDGEDDGDAGDVGDLVEGRREFVGERDRNRGTPEGLGFWLHGEMIVGERREDRDRGVGPPGCVRRCADGVRVSVNAPVTDRVKRDLVENRAVQVKDRLGLREDFARA